VSIYVISSISLVELARLLPINADAAWFGYPKSNHHFVNTVASVACTRLPRATSSEVN
jgi:hypothetical protein